MPSQDGDNVLSGERASESHDFVRGGVNLPTSTGAPVASTFVLFEAGLCMGHRLISRCDGRCGFPAASARGRNASNRLHGQDARTPTATRRVSQKRIVRVHLFVTLTQSVITAESIREKARTFPQS